jgi:NTE family protein
MDTAATDTNTPLAKPFRTPGRPPFECVALTLQGGGALGAYQAGVYQALDESNIRPDWVAGISIGAINAAIIPGNKPENRVVRLREFWMTVTPIRSAPESPTIPDASLMALPRVAP